MVPGLLQGLQQLLEDERVLEDSALLDGSLDLQLVMLSDLGPEQMPMCLYPLWDFFIFCLYKTQEDIKHSFFIKVLRGV